MSVFGDVKEAPPIEVFSLCSDFKKDESSNKVNLSIGAYRTDEGKPWVLPCVRSVETAMASDSTLNKEYLPITGFEELCTKALELVLGEKNPLIAAQKTDSCQTLGGTGAIYLALQFLKLCGCTVAYVSRPTWPNHSKIAVQVGLEVKEYRYWDVQRRNIDFAGMKADLSDAPKRAVVILHACAHNPTGLDPSKKEWMAIADIVKMNQLIPLFDIAYQGFATGNLEEDAWAIRHFASNNIEMLIAQSFSKNFGLYNERVGALHVISCNKSTTSNAKSQIKTIIRRTWSNPPQHGGLIVSRILNNPQLTTEWKSNLATMAKRIKAMREKLFQQLTSLNTPGTWDHILQQCGMFSYSGLTKQQVEYMRSTHHIYLMSDGRINICGLTPDNVSYVANAIRDSVIKFPAQ